MDNKTALGSRSMVISDLDGTIADIEHRRHWLDRDQHPDMTLDERWRKFFAESVNDAPNLPVIHTLQALNRAGYEIHIFSGRSDEVMESTLIWLMQHGVPFASLKMRTKGDFTPDEVLKGEWIKDYDLKQILCVFDDRSKVVAVWRSLGLACFQVAPGNF